MKLSFVFFSKSKEEGNYGKMFNMIICVGKSAQVDLN